MTLAIALGVGLVASLLLAELLAIAPGGYIVPGYLAVTLNHPERVVVTVLIAAATMLLMKAVGRFVILYGMRRFVLFLLVGFTLGAVYTALAAHVSNDAVEAIGFVVPGLIALWMEKQGSLVTLGSMTIVTVIARLALLLVVRI